MPFKLLNNVNRLRVQVEITLCVNMSTSTLAVQCTRLRCTAHGNIICTTRVKVPDNMHCTNWDDWIGLLPHPPSGAVLSRRVVLSDRQCQTCMIYVPVNQWLKSKQSKNIKVSDHQLCAHVQLSHCDLWSRNEK